MDHSAGIIFVRFKDGVPYILCLRAYSSFDFPKGKIEEGESELAAAVRETEEEAGLTEIGFDFGYDTIKLMNDGKHKKEVTLFMATTEQEPEIRKNPDTGKYEHHGFGWLSLPDAEESLHPYLRPAVAWVRSKLAERKAIEEFVRLQSE